MIEKFFRLIIVNPRNTFFGIISLTIMWTIFIPNLSIDFSIEHLFSQNDPAVERYFSFRETFGREDNIITIIYEPVDALSKELYKELEDLLYQIEDINGVDNIISIFSLSDIDSKPLVILFICKHSPIGKTEEPAVPILIISSGSN